MADAATQPSASGSGVRTLCDSLVIHGATDEEAPWTLEPQMPVYLLGDDDHDPFVGLVKNMWLEPDGEARCVIRWFYRCAPGPVRPAQRRERRGVTVGVNRVATAPDLMRHAGQPKSTTRFRSPWWISASCT